MRHDERWFSRWLGALLALGAVTACGGDDNGGDAGGGLDGSTMDAGPGRREGGPPPDEMCVAALAVDMIWVVDNSNSMEQEQASLAVNFPVLLEVLTNPPDSDGDGELDFPPLEDLRIAVVTTDLGVGENAVLGCDGEGDGARFIDTSRSPDPACAGVTIGPPPWLEFMPSADAAAFNRDFACIAQLGTDGCGLEQQLESSLQAVVDLSAPGMPHEGFLRDDSIVAIVYVTDEDDCSASDARVFDPSPAAAAELGHIRPRCALHPELLHPVSRYATAFRNLTLDRRGDVLVAAITGVPRDLTDVADPTTIDYDALLADERMQFRLVDGDDTQLQPACEFGGVGSAVPARRIVELVQEFAQTGDGIAQSICAPDLRPAIESIAKLIARRLCPPPI